MSFDSAVAWAKKMADVLGEAVLPSNSEQVAKAPRGGAAPSMNGSNGAPAANGSPSTGGTPTAAPTANGTPAANGTPSSNGTPAANGESGNGPGSGPTGTSAKACAEAAQKAANDVAAVLTQAQTAETEAKTFVTDAEAAKKLVDDAKTQAETAETAIGRAPSVAAPQGDDAKAQYDSSIQITGEVRKAQSDAEANESLVREQITAAGDGFKQLESVEKKATQHAEKAKQLVEQANSFAQSAASSASGAASAAAASKTKADQAKDDAPDKAALQRTAQEDAQSAATAKEAASKAEASAKQISTAVESATTQSKSVEKTTQEAQTVVDAVTQKKMGLQEKLGPYYMAVWDAEAQEAACKAKLSEAEAEEILRKRYEELGGNPELTKALADEDKDFVTRTELYRADLKNWQKEKIRELDDYKSRLDKTLKDGESVLPPAKKFLEREMPIGASMASEVNGLGEKLKTEPGKELLHEYSSGLDKIETVQQKKDFNQKVIDKTQAALDALMPRYKDVDAQYEASEKLISESRTELDNILQMDQMDLEAKIDFLQVRPKPVRDRIQKKLDAELSRVTKIGMLETNAEEAVYDFPSEPLEINPIDWEAIKAKVAKLNAATLEELQQDDPKRADAKEEYENAGGDQALLNKRLAEWKKEVEQLNEGDKGRANDYQSRAAKLNQQLQEATLKLRESEANVNGFQSALAQEKARYNDLKKTTAGKNSTPQEKAQFLLLEKEIKRIETQLKNYQAEAAADKVARANAEHVVEVERQRHEQVMDDDRRPLPKPTSEDIQRMPFAAKYTELTGKFVPA